MRLRPRTLLWQLGLVLMAMQLAVAVILGSWSLVKLKRFHAAQTEEQLDRLAALVARQVEPLLSGPSEQVQAAAVALRASAHVRVTVVTAEGRVIGESDLDPSAMDDHRYRPEIDTALRMGRGSAVRFSRSTGQQMTYVARAIPPTGAPVAVVRVAMPMAAVNAELGRLVRVIGVAGMISLGLTFGVIYLVSGNLSRTVTRLARGARRFATGRLGHRIADPGSNELAMVTQAFNRMAAQIERQIDELQAQQTEQEAILQTMRNGVLALDGEQRLLAVNQAAERLLNIEGSSARGRLLQEVVREPELHSLVAEAMAESRQVARELAIRHGTRRTLEAVAEPLVGGRRPAPGLLVVLNDITQLRRLESIRSDFAANVSHELQTPITAIKGYVETLLDMEPPPSPEARRFLDIVSRNADRLAAIIEDLLALARLEEPDAPRSLERQPTELQPLLDSVAGQFEKAASEKGMTLTVDASPDLSAQINARLVEQAVSNLVSNAVKFGPRDSTVSLRAAAANGSLRITVADEGPGIPAEHLERLFERFYRVDRARSRELGGTGLGLAIVKHIAAVHGGRAHADSEVGRGSVFTITIPDLT